MGWSPSFVKASSEVHATHLYDRPTFEVARQMLESSAEYHPRTSIEDLVTKFGRGRFDLVVMGGLLYHLVSPLRSLLIAGALVKNNGLVILETVTGLGDSPSMVFNPAAPIVDEYTTFFVPNESCVVEMMRFCLLDTLSIASVPSSSGYTRTSYLARARMPANGTHSTDLMKRAQERASRSSDDRLMDEFSFALLEEEPRSAISVNRVDERVSINTREFTSRFHLQSPDGVTPWCRAGTRRVRV